MTVQTGLTYAHYADLPGLRSSHLSALAQSPLHYRRPKPRKGYSTELRLIHALALEGEDLDLLAADHFEQVVGGHVHGGGPRCGEAGRTSARPRSLPHDPRRVRRS